MQLILGPIVHQKQNSRICHRVHEHVEKRLALVVQPMQVLDDQNERVPRCFAQEHTNDRIERARSPELRVHASEALLIVFNLQQCVDIGEDSHE